MKESIAIVSEVKLWVEDRMVIADPCYVDQDDGQTSAAVLAARCGGEHFPEWGVVLDDCAGEWTAEIDMADNRQTCGWGDRVSTLRLVRETVHGTDKHRYAQELLGHNAVDSGQMYAAGVEHLPVDYDKLLAQYGSDFSERILASNGGVVCSTGYGDGVYNVWAWFTPEGRPVIVEVRFIDDEDWEDEEEEDDE